MLGWRAARSFHAGVGDTVRIEELRFTVTGIHSTGNAVGDEGAMFPLPALQAWHRKPGLVTLVFVRTRPGADIAAVRRTIDAEHPQLTTIHTLTEFGRADRNLVLIRAANAGGSLLALVIGASGVMNTSLLSYYERIREFGVLRSIGWSRRRVFVMVLLEAFAVAFAGAALGVVIGFGAVRGLTRLPQLVGVFRPAYETAIFTRALSFATGMALLGAAYPALKTARISPLDALRRES
jgi:putative ABC transport system permease protein